MTLLTLRIICSMYYLKISEQYLIVKKIVLITHIKSSYQRILHCGLKCDEINLIKRSHYQEASKYNLNDLA